jgi:hypothetical protein
MGGNAIKNARRIDKGEFFQICHELQDIFPELKMKPVKAYYQKDDFGDIDMIVETQPTLNIEELVRDRLSPADEYANGPYYSFAYKGVQVDFIKTSSQYFLSTLSYMNFNDIGNFFGRVARGLNFKYGSDGLSYEYHIDDHYKISVNITADSAKALEFLGYDSKVWLAGFDTKEDIFQFVTTSKYFNAQYFTLEEQAHADRIRNRKRKMYQAMLEYISEKGIAPRPKLTPEERLVEYDRARLVFGDKFHIEVETAKANYEKQKAFKKLFNGTIVSELTGLAGKQLGQFMAHVRANHDNPFQSFEESITDEQHVANLVMNSYFESFGGRFTTDDEKEIYTILNDFKDVTPISADISQSAGIANYMYKTDKGLYNVLYDIYAIEVIEVQYVIFSEMEPSFG